MRICSICGKPVNAGMTDADGSFYTHDGECFEKYMNSEFGEGCWIGVNCDGWGGYYMEIDPHHPEYSFGTGIFYTEWEDDGIGISPDTYDKILEALPHHPSDRPRDNWHGFWVNGRDEIMCESEEVANVIAYFFEDCGFDVMNTSYYNDAENDGQNYGWWAVYVDGQ